VPTRPRAARAGAVIEEGVGVGRIVQDGGRVVGVETDAGFVAAGTVVVAAGLHTPALLAPLGLRMPIAPHVVSVLQTAPLPPIFAQVFGVANADCAGRQEISGRLRVTSGIGPWSAPVEGWTEDLLAPPAREVRRLVGLIGEVLPALLDAPVARLWGGLIDLTPDALPVIDTPAGGLVVAAGFSGHGFGIGPVTGRLVADLASGRAPALDVAAFRMSRFDGANDTSARAALTLHG
jgi:sarcosine oxidase subunit beta